ncbi:MAG: adenylate/guanylate cyclase domain-containing protein [Candidatus Riflebacteria bacterium]|nr:adenylate/guanylate cyclase domain-containing protein [Candidatus Riflebacteria bacterium]
MSRSLVVALVVVLFVGATLALANWTRAAGARQWQEALVDEATRETFQELDRVQTTADIESQIGSLLNVFAARVRAAAGGPRAAARGEQAWRELLQPNLPPHDLFVYGPAAGSMAAPLLFSHEHPLGFGAVADEYSLFLDSFTDQDPTGRPRSSFPDSRIRALARGIRDHVGAAFPLEPTIRPRADVMDFRTADRRLFLIWEEYGSLGKVVLLMDGSHLAPQHPLRVMAGRWARRGTGVAFWDHWRHRLTSSGLVRRVPGLARDIAALAERHRDAPRFSEQRLHQGPAAAGPGEGLPGEGRHEGRAPPSGAAREPFRPQVGGSGPGEAGGADDPVRFLVAGGPFLPGGRFRPVMVRALPVTPARIPPGEAALFAASLLLFGVTVWAAVEGAVFGRRPAFPVRVVLVFAFVLVAILPLSGVGFFVHALTREWVDRERDRLARELHEDLRAIDTSFERTLASYTWQLRSWTRDPAVQGRLERALATDDPEAVVREFQAIIERFRAHNTVKFAAVVGPRGLFAAWRIIFSAIHRRYLDTILEKVMQSTLSQHLGEFNPDLAGTGPGGPAVNAPDRGALYREMGYQSLFQIVGPQGFITMVAYPEEMLRVTLRATWLGMFSVPVPIQRTITFVFRWHLVNRELEYLHLQSQIGPHEADDPGNARFGVCGSQDYYFPPVPAGLDVASYDGLLAAADQVFNSQIGMRFREDDRPDRRLVEIMVPRQLCSILVGTRATAWLDEAARRAHAAASLILFLILLAAILIGALTAGFFLEPLRALRQGAREIGRGNLAARLDIRRGDEFDDLADTFNRMAQGLQEGRTLGRFVSSAVREMVGAGRMGEGPAPAHRCRATILFSQVVPAAAARGDPDRFFACLDAHLRAIEEATGRFGGDIDKIIGEKVLVVFSHEAFPTGQAAAAAAFRVVRALERARPGLPLAERLVAGITTGEVVSGVLGAASVRLDHTVIGDPVNLAARLADLARRMDGEAVILAAGEAVRLAGWQRQARRLDLTAVKGKTQQVEAWRLAAEGARG